MLATYAATTTTSAGSAGGPWWAAAGLALPAGGCMVTLHALAGDGGLLLVVVGRYNTVPGVIQIQHCTRGDTDTTLFQG